MTLLVPAEIILLRVVITLFRTIRILHECEDGIENPSRESPSGITRLAE